MFLLLKTHSLCDTLSFNLHHCWESNGEGPVVGVSRGALPTRSIIAIIESRWDSMLRVA